MKKNSFVEGTVVATLSIVIVKLLGMLYVIPFYAIVGSDGGALYSYGYNIYLIFLGISSAGLPDAIAKIGSEYGALGYQDAKEKAYRIGKRLIGAIALISFILIMIFASYYGNFMVGKLNGNNTPEDVAFVVRCVAPAVLFIPFLSMMKGYLQGHKFISASSMSQLIEQVVRIFVILFGSFIIIKVFNGSLSLAVGISVAGAFFGGLGAYLYLRHQIHKHKAKFVIPEAEQVKKDIPDKVIRRKIIKYAIPFIIISIVANLYNMVDQKLVLTTLNMLHYKATVTEFIGSAISTWSPKICMVINAMSMGLSMSLVPTIVTAYTKKDNKEVENKVNKSISMILFISLPLSIGICVLASSVWSVFYGVNSYGTTILRLTAFSALFGNIYMIVAAICQSLNKFKLVYTLSATGFILNALLDMPIMLLFDKVGIPPYLGSVTASIVGYSVSIYIGLRSLRKENGISYKDTFINLGKTLIPALCMLAVILPMQIFIPFTAATKLGCIINIAALAVVGGLIYIVVSFKSGIVEEILGRRMVNKLLRKFTFGKIQLKD